MVGSRQDVGNPTPFQGLVYHSVGITGIWDRDTSRGIHQPLNRGWNTLSSVAIPLCYRGLCLHQPLSGVDRSHAGESRAHYDMVGYAYVNLRASESRAKRSFSSAERRRRSCEAPPLSGVDRSHTGEARAHYGMVGYAYINPLAGLISEGLIELEGISLLL